MPQRGRGLATAFPSPVVILSILAVAMAAIAFVATRGQGPAEREVALPASSSPSVSAAPTIKPDPQQPAIDRGEVPVEVYNNSGEQGLAALVGDHAAGLGWQVVGTDNWYGTIPASTVYFPARLQREARQLALDLGVKRVMPAVDPMRGDRLTVILTARPAGFR